MPSEASLVAFVIASLVVLLIPGPGVLYVVARSAAQGYRAGLASVLGLSTGAFVHVIAAAVGLSAILLASATAFNVVKLVGAGYLIYLGIRTLLDRQTASSPQIIDRLSFRRLFMDGVAVSVFNPKIAIFFLAYLPQFIDPNRGPVPQQILLLGVIYVGLALLTDGSFAVLAGSLRRWVTGTVMRGPLPRYVTGGIYIGLGVHAALADRQR